jgi:hypothetical protein
LQNYAWSPSHIQQLGLAEANHAEWSLRQFWPDWPYRAKEDYVQAEPGERDSLIYGDPAGAPLHVGKVIQDNDCLAISGHGSGLLPGLSCDPAP